jgi:hypothetical protein
MVEAFFEDAAFLNLFLDYRRRGTCPALQGAYYLKQKIFHI